MQCAQDLWLDHLQAATHYNQWIFAYLQPHIRGRTLEVGCGTGNFTELIAQNCSQLVAVDLNSDYASQAKARLKPYEHVEVTVADATKMVSAEPFDTIILLDVLEHIEKDVELLQQLFSYLAPDGTLILKVPALNYLYNALDEAVGHHRRYTPQTLRDAIAQASFGNVTTEYFNIVGIFGWWLNGSVLKRVTPPGEQVGLFDRCVPLFRAVESVVPCPVGLSLFAAAVRRA